MIAYLAPAQIALLAVCAVTLRIRENRLTIGLALGSMIFTGATAVAGIGWPA